MISRRPKAGARGGCGGAGAPPPNDDSKATERRSARSLSAGQRPASRGSVGAELGWMGGPGTTIQNYNYITTVLYHLPITHHEAEGRVNGAGAGGREPPRYHHPLHHSTINFNLHKGVITLIIH